MPPVKPNTKNSEELKLYDIKKKLSVARHIVKACMDNTIIRSDIRKNHFYVEARDYISSSKSLTSSIFERIQKLDKPRTFSDWFQDIYNESNDNNNDPTMDVLLRNAIVDHYVYKQSLPNINSICEHLNKNVCLTVKQVKKLLKTRGYKTQSLQRKNLTIIVENPEQRYQRMKFLNRMIKLRELNYHIVHVDEKIINNIKGNGESIQILAAASCATGIISQTINKAIFTNNDENITVVDDWIINNILPKLTKSSVLVLGNTNSVTESFNNIPTIYSRKNDMISWLQQNDIPHSSEMHTAELFQLIERSKWKFPSRKYKLDEILAGHGHKVLRRPKRTQYLNFFEPIWKQILDNFVKEDQTDISYFIKRSLFSISEAQWKNLEYNLIKMEVNVYNDDGAVDEVIDKILTLAKYETFPHAYLEECDEDIDELKMSKIVLV